MWEVNYWLFGSISKKQDMEGDPFLRQIHINPISF